MDPTLVVQAIHAFFDGNSQAKHYNHVYKPIKLLTHCGPQNAAPQVALEALAKEDEFQAME